MKSEPELAELIATVEGIEVTMAEKGFGTRVRLRAAEAERAGRGRPRGGPRPARRTAAPALQLDRADGSCFAVRGGTPASARK